MCRTAEFFFEAAHAVKGQTHNSAHPREVTSELKPSYLMSQKPQTENNCIVSPFVQLSQHMQAAQPTAVRHPFQPACSDSTSAAPWTPYNLPEAHALLAMQRAAALRLRL